jgi:hypothetical protein
VALVEILVLGLVVYRVWRLIGRDVISEPLRLYLERSPRVLDLVDCPWCLGTWLTIIAGLVTTETGLTSTSPWLLIPAAATIVGFLGNHDTG